MSCEVCGKTEQLKTCAKCLRANYCSRDHQIAHWQIHRQWCTPPEDTNNVNNTNNLQNHLSQSDPNSLNSHQNLQNLQNFNDAPGTTTGSTTATTTTTMLNGSLQNTGQYYSNQGDVGQRAMDNYMELNAFQMPAMDESGQQQSLQQQGFNSLPEPVNQFNQRYSPDGSFPQDGNVYDNVLDERMNTQLSMNGSSTQSTMNPQCQVPMSVQFSSQRDFILQNLNRYCQMILNDMNQYGFCVIDDFLQNGDQILSEVLTLYQNGRFRNGQVVNSKGTPDAKLIRGDQIVWVEYSEPSCNNVGFLIRILDSIVARCNATMGGEFGKYNITRRTKAMIACYPGNYSKYVRHIDNPNNDGRCITSIYYLNKDYNRQKDGGVLRLFPQMNNSIVADVEPKFNRVIFFWSDRRNPHEVMPSARMRFAITVWYFDETERAKARQKLKQAYPQYPNDKALVPF